MGKSAAQADAPKKAAKPGKAAAAAAAVGKKQKKARVHRPLDIPTEAARRIFRSQGVARVTYGAVEAMSVFLRTRLAPVVADSVRCSRNSGRHCVSTDDATRAMAANGRTIY